MSRLIDADNFKVFLHNLQDTGAEHVSFENLHKFLDEEPTAYDVDKVVEQLNGKIKELEDISHCIVIDKERKAQNRGYYAAMNHAIEIVKDGGLNG